MRRNIIKRCALGMALVLLLGACGQQVETGDTSETAVHNQNAGEDTTVEVAETEAVIAAEDAVIGLSKQSGIYESTFSLTLEAPAGYRIYYTLDGRDPAGVAGMLYDGEITIVDRRGKENILSAIHPTLFCANNNKRDTNKQYYCLWEPPTDAAVDKAVCLRAACVNANGEWSRETRANYFIGDVQQHIPGIKESCEAAGSRLAVICMTVNEEDLFDHANGIYVKGDRFEADYLEPYVKGDARNADANYKGRGREWEREASIEFYEVDESGMEYAFGQTCGIRIQGNYSRSDLQKSFRFYARDSYGKKKFSYPIFGEACTDVNGEVIDSYKTFVVRAGGNCALTCKFSDAYWQNLVRQGQMQVTTKHSRPCILYINGEYWGVYVLEEDYSAKYLEDHYGVDDASVVVYKGDAETYALGYKLDEGELPEGAEESYYYEDLLSFFQTHTSLESAEDYEEFCALVDPESVLDYFAIETWINNKWDWPGKNWSMWRVASADEAADEVPDAADVSADEANEENSENPYADGRWRFMLYDDEFGGVSGRSDATTNTVKEDNYKPMGLLDMDTKNPAVLCFAYLMTNQAFKQRYAARLNEISNAIFEREHALAVLDDYKNIYAPLMQQFFDRFPDSGSVHEAMEGGYASAKCIRDFLEERADYIPQMLSWVMMQ